MKIPVFDNIKFVDKEGYLTPGWSNILQELFQSLQADFSDEGLVIPSQTAADIAKLTDAPNWTVIGDTTNNLLKIKINGVWKSINTTP